MNLVLSFNGKRTKVEKAHPHDSIATDNTETTADTQPPNIPHAMKLLPTTLPYVESSCRKPPAEKSADDSCDDDRNSATSEPAADPSTPKNVIFVDEVETNDGKSSPGSRRHSNPFTTIRRNLFRRKSASKHKALNASNQSLEVVAQANETVTSSPFSACNYRLIYEIAQDSDQSTPKRSPNPSTGKRRMSVYFNNQTLKNGDDGHLTRGENGSPANGASDGAKLKPPSPHHSTFNRKMSQDSVGSFFHSSPFCGRRGTKRSLISRRHSDGLLPMPSKQAACHEYGSTSKHANHCHCHTRHHHNHHHTPHPKEQRDSFFDGIGAASVSERCSNSIASSQSSASLVSQHPKRKISITSHSQTNGKIPWCACWGNGCL